MPGQGAQIQATFLVSGAGFSSLGEIRRFVRQAGASRWSEIGMVEADPQGDTLWRYTPDCGHPPGLSHPVMVDGASLTATPLLTFIVTPFAGCSSLQITSMEPQEAQRGTATTFTCQGVGFDEGLRAELISKHGIFPVPHFEWAGPSEVRVRPYIDGGATEDMRIRLVRADGLADSRWFRAVAGGGGGSATVAAAPIPAAIGETVQVSA